MKRTRWVSVVTCVALALTVAGCGDDDDDDAAAKKDEKTEKVASTTPKQEPAAAPKIEIKAHEYGFDVPATVSAGLVDMTLDNTGKEPHFAAYAQPAEGKTIEDVKAAIMAIAEGKAEAGPPPFVEFMALGTVDPGGQSRMTANLPEGKYVLFCLLPAVTDGVPHAAKGMMKEVEATGGSARGLPDTDSTLTTVDFAIGGTLKFKAGMNSVTQENKGKQIHEVDLVELAEGKTVDDIVTWAAKLEGPPPGHFLGGPAVRDGLSVTTTFKMEEGKRYAFVCIVPDHLGDGAPHILKGMHTVEFEVTP